MITKILVANRGEIAIRIINSAKLMGIKTVAIYSDVDRNSMHVNLADEACFVGPAPSHQSYLKIENIVEAIKQSGADAVHPGYGFLSENAKFIEAIEELGVTFIGPSADAVRAMGDKITSKKIAIEAGVNTIPGYTGTVENAEKARKIADDIGYPVMIKAAAGGGGKGMRVVYKAEEVESAFSASSNEARKSFGDDRIFIEKFIENPRHIEIQLLADKYGNNICLGERECSIQRNNQKVIEESPSPFLDEETRKIMYEQTIKLGKKVGYYSAGTVEYIMDINKNFYFLEMNTRLQVEHPVTELVTRVDIVQEMINIANDKKLDKTQDDVEIKGWAMESRIYAEDPSCGFLPSSGRISEYQEPIENRNVRIDTGVCEGAEVSMFYDPMIAKLCTYGDSRNEAIALMQDSLGDYVITGVSHNINFLQSIMHNENFIAGNLSTDFIAKEYPDGFKTADIDSAAKMVFVATTIFAHMTDIKRNSQITGQLKHGKRVISGRLVVAINDEQFAVYVREILGGYSIEYNGRNFNVLSSWTPGHKLFRGVVANQKVSVQCHMVVSDYVLTHLGSTAIARVITPRVAELLKYMPKSDKKAKYLNMKAPISGLIVDIKVKEGEEVRSGQDIIIIEAMKMENILRAEHDVTVKAIKVTKGANVTVNDTMIELE